MTRLTDTQLIVLSAAAQRADRLALPLPKSLKGGAAHKVIKPLIDKGLLEEIAANRKLGDPVWRDTGDGHGVTLVITAAGLAALGLQPETAAQETSESSTPSEATTASELVTATVTPPQARKTREGTKQAAMIAMLRRPEGATIDELVAATQWKSHTIRGAMAGALKKKLGLEIASGKAEGRGRIYFIR